MEEEKPHFFCSRYQYCKLVSWFMHVAISDASQQCLQELLHYSKGPTSTRLCHYLFKSEHRHVPLKVHTHCHLPRLWESESCSEEARDSSMLKRQGNGERKNIGVVITGRGVTKRQEDRGHEEMRPLEEDELSLTASKGERVDKHREIYGRRPLKPCHTIMFSTLYENLVPYDPILWRWNIKYNRKHFWTYTYCFASSWPSIYCNLCLTWATYPYLVLYTSPNLYKRMAAFLTHAEFIHVHLLLLILSRIVKAIALGEKLRNPFSSATLFFSWGISKHSQARKGT